MSSVAQSPAWLPHTLTYFSSHPLLTFKCKREPTNVLFSGAFKMLLPSVWCQFGSNQLIKILYRGDISYINIFLVIILR